MLITIIKKGNRFGGRAGAIIYNEDKTKVLLEKQKNIRYVFPGGRLEMHEDSITAIKRELKEELNIEPDLKLKYIVEIFEKSSIKKYHEIGFYHLATINENEVENNFISLDGDSTFIWVPINELENYKVVIKPIRDKVINDEIKDLDLEHLVYRAY